MSTPRLTSSRGSDFPSRPNRDHINPSHLQEKQRLEAESLPFRNASSLGSQSMFGSMPNSSISPMNSVGRVPSTASNLVRVPTVPLHAHPSILPSTLHRPSSAQSNRVTANTSPALSITSGVSPSSTSSSIPLHTLRSTNQRFNPLSSDSLQPINSTASLDTISYSHLFNSDSAIDDESVSSHSSGRGTLANFTYSNHPSHSRNLNDGTSSLSDSHSKTSTPGSASSSINSYSQFISNNASPRKNTESLVPPKTANSVSPTPLRFHQQTNTALNNNILPMRIATNDRATPSKSSKFDSTGSAQTVPSHKAAVRGNYHISASSSTGSMHSGGYFPVSSPEGSLRSQDTSHHHRSTGGLNVLSPSSTSAQSSVINVWNRDLQANKSKGVRPSSSNSAQRPVTARANLLSMACDDSTRAYEHSVAKTARTSGKDRVPHATHVPPRTAVVGSSGAQARARSAFVLRPPSRQRPPNQALHLGGGVGSPETDRPISLLSSSMTQSEHGSSSSTRVNSKSSWSHSHPVVDLFPAAPVELVRAVKSAKRERTKPAFGLEQPADATSFAQVSNHESAASLSQVPHDESASSDWDTEDTASIETDDGSIDRDQFNLFAPPDVTSNPLRSDNTSFGFSVGSDSSDHASVLGSPSSFVSLHNILQLQAESGYGSRSKSRQGSASSNRKLTAHRNQNTSSAAETLMQRPPATAQPMTVRPQMDDTVYGDATDHSIWSGRPLVQQDRPVSRRVHKRAGSRSAVMQPNEVEF